MAFRKRSAFEDSNRAPPKNSYEAFERKTLKPLKDYDMRPHWAKNVDTAYNKGNAERAGADEEDHESLKLLKKEMGRSAYDDVMDIVLGSQLAIHSRCVAAHEDRMNILREFCGYDVWEEAEADKAPGAAKSVMMENDAFDHEGAAKKVAIKTFVANNKNDNSNNGSAPIAGSENKNTNTSALSSIAVERTIANLAAPSPAKLHFSRGGVSTNSRRNHDDVDFAYVSSAPLHVAILTPPFHGCIPLDDRHLSKGSVAYKMEKSIKQMNDAVVQFQIANEIAREEAEKEKELLLLTVEKQKLQRSTKNGRNVNDSSKSNNNNNNNNNSLQPPAFATTSAATASSQLSVIMEQRMARERRLEEGLFTPFFHQDSVNGLAGVPWADPNATSPPRVSSTGGIRRYPEPYAFVIH